MWFFGKKKTNIATDSELIDRYRATGDSKYVGVLYERYSHLVFGLCLKYLQHQEESKDMVIGIFEQVIQELKKHEVQYFSTWLFSLSRNQCLNHIRSKGRQRKREEIFSTADSLVKEDPTGEQRIEEYSDKAVGEAIESLKAEQRICIELFYFQNQSYLEITKQTGYSGDEVKSHLQNGKRNLKIFLMKNYGSR